MNFTVGEFTVIKSSEVSYVKPRWSLPARRDKQRHHIDSPIRSHCSWLARRQIGHLWMPASLLDVSRRTVSAEWYNIQRHASHGPSVYAQRDAQENPRQPFWCRIEHTYGPRSIVLARDEKVHTRHVWCMWHLCPIRYNSTKWTNEICPDTYKALPDSQARYLHDNRSYLVAVCHFSNRVEVDPLGDTSSSTVVNKTKAHFAQYGVPAICHTDNSPLLVSEQYRTFSVAYGFKHTTWPPFRPKGNWRAEAAIKVAKSMLKKADDFHSALLLYRNTSPLGHTYSPAQHMFLCRTRTLLPTTDQLLAPAMINFDTVKEDILKKRHDSKTYYNKLVGVEHKPKLGVTHMPNHHPVIAANPGSMGKWSRRTTAGPTLFVPLMLPWFEGTESNWNLQQHHQLFSDPRQPST